jgi:hypothetical protein
VYSPRVEGVHLRFGKVARGGLRWSDRREDFRTEILGLVKAQAVKNAVIVPVGAKGGFVVKRPPDPTGDPTGRPRELREGIACYRMFISGLLDLTDNLVDADEVVPARDVVRHDGDDTYLVVAADKGTATFSDIANEVAPKSYGFWLGDAFASGGSARLRPQGDGHHRARRVGERQAALPGARASTPRPRTSRSSASATCPGTSSATGCCCRAHPAGGRLRPPAHLPRPDPDAAVSYAERKRLFELPRSSWEDYDRSLISEGRRRLPALGEVDPAEPAGPKQALGIDRRIVTSDDAPELIRAILKAPVDLLWNGGIGTYVKASLGDARRRGRQGQRRRPRQRQRSLRARVVGEGGNLGFTQRGRIEYARNGGRINTDCHRQLGRCRLLGPRGEHQDPARTSWSADGELTLQRRNALLAEMTDEVAELVLAATTTGRTRVLGHQPGSQARGVSCCRCTARQVASTWSSKGAARTGSWRRCPAPGEFAAVGRRPVTGLSSPELATLLAHVKLDVKERAARQRPAGRRGRSARRLRGVLPDEPLRRALRRRTSRSTHCGGRSRHDPAGERGGGRCGRVVRVPAGGGDSVLTCHRRGAGVRRGDRRLRAAGGVGGRSPRWTAVVPTARPRTRWCWRRGGCWTARRRWMLSNRPQPLARSADCDQTGSPNASPHWWRSCDGSAAGEAARPGRAGGGRDGGAGGPRRACRRSSPERVAVAAGRATRCWTSSRSRRWPSGTASG